MTRTMMGMFMCAALAACGGGGGAAESKCNDLVDVTCNRTEECIAGVTHDQCVDAVNQQIDCGDADRVGATYDSCMDMLMSDDCNTLFPGGQLVLPADCNGVIIVDP